MKSKFLEKLMEIVFFISACASIISVILICFFIFANGFPAIAEIGIFKFLLGRDWSPSNVPPSFGIFPMILGSLYVTAGAIIIGVPIGVLTAIYLAKFCPKRIYSFETCCKSYGRNSFYCLWILWACGISAFIQKHFGGNGYSIITASFLLGIMILPTIISLSEAAIRAVPGSYYEGSVALGATHEYSTMFAVVPAANQG